MVDEKAERFRPEDKEDSESQGMFIYDRKSVVMKKWQILEFDGKPYYAFVPENDEPFDTGDETSEVDGNEECVAQTKEEILTDDYIYYDEQTLVNDSSFYKEVESNAEDGTMSCGEYDEENDGDDDELDSNNEKSTKTRESDEAKNILLGNVYEVKIEAGTVTLERVTKSSENSNVVLSSSAIIKQEASHEISDYEMNETLVEVLQNDYITGNSGIEREKNEENEDIEEDEDEDELEEYEDEDQEEFLEESEMEGQPETSNTKPGTTDELEDRYPGDSMTTASTTVGPLKCKACSETFGSTIAFRKHVAWTHKKKVCIQEDGAYICSVCDYRTLKKSLFAAHLERKHETWTRKRQSNMYFPCETCGFICRSKHSLQSHFIRKHTDRYEHACEFCTKKFKVKGDLTNHIRFHHKEKPINCDVCGKLCQNTGSLYVHQKWAHYKPKYECQICKRRMVTQENLDQHLITQHEQREKIVCAQCGKTFTKKDSFKRHMSVHTGNKPHPCPICAKPFARQSQLRQHVLIHTGQRPFICDICGKGFTQKPGLICHRKTHPGPHPPLPVMPIADLVRDFIAQNEESQSHFIDLE